MAFKVGRHAMISNTCALTTRYTSCSKCEGQLPTNVRLVNVSTQKRRDALVARCPLVEKRRALPRSAMRSVRSGVVAAVHTSEDAGSLFSLPQKNIPADVIERQAREAADYGQASHLPWTEDPAVLRGYASCIHSAHINQIPRSAHTKAPLHIYQRLHGL
jgi:hypothetical protein